MELTVGTVLQNGKYLVNQVSNQGHTGVTLYATQSNGQRVMIQSLQPSLQTHSDYIDIKQQFDERVQRFANCKHPACVQLTDTFEEQHLPFAVTDRPLGQSLAQLIQQQGVLSEQKALQYIYQVGSALRVLHQHHLLHQRVTPHNIIHPAGSEIVILVNVEFSQPRALGTATDAMNTLPMGEEYAAIEQFLPQPFLTPAADLYALAGTLYFLLTGHAPIAASLRTQTALIPPRQLRPHLSSHIEHAILHGLAINPQSRPPSIAAWFNQLSMHTAPNQRSEAAFAQSVSSGSIKSSGKKSHALTKPNNHLESVSKVNHHSMISLSSRRFPSAVLTTAAIAAAIGVGTGIFLRLAANTTGPGTSFLHSEQSFPVLDGWPGEVPLQQTAPVAAPVVTAPRPTVAPIQPTPTPTFKPTAPPTSQALEPEPAQTPTPAPTEPVMTVPQSSDTPAAVPAVPTITPRETMTEPAPPPTQSTSPEPEPPTTPNQATTHQSPPSPPSN